MYNSRISPKIVSCYVGEQRLQALDGAGCAEQIRLDCFAVMGSQTHLCILSLTSMCIQVRTPEHTIS